MPNVRMQTASLETSHRILRGMQYSIDFLTAILLLTGQITTSGIYIVPNGFFLAGTGPILGGVRLEGVSPATKYGLDIVDIINALLLIIDQVRVTGPFFTSGRVYMVWTGDIFGLERFEVSGPEHEERQALRRFMKEQMMNQSTRRS